MRWTVLSSDALIFFPAVLYFINVYYYGKPVRRKSSLAWHIAMLLLNPCLILIDHGHFQVCFIFRIVCSLTFVTLFLYFKILGLIFFLFSFICFAVQLY